MGSGSRIYESILSIGMIINQNRGLVKQQIDSYNYFINIGIKKIMEANKEIRSDVNHKFFVQYQNIYIGDPMVLEDSQIINNKVFK